MISSFPAIFLSCVKKNSHILYKRGNCSGHRKRAVLCIIFLSEYPKATVILTIPTYLLTYIRLRIHSFKIFSVEMERVINKNVWVLGTSWAKLLISFKRIFFRKEWGISVIIFFSQQTQISEQKIFKTSCRRYNTYLLF